MHRVVIAIIFIERWLTGTSLVHVQLGIPVLANPKKEQTFLYIAFLFTEKKGIKNINKSLPLTGVVRSHGALNDIKTLG